MSPAQNSSKDLAQKLAEIDRLPLDADTRAVLQIASVLANWLDDLATIVSENALDKLSEASKGEDMAHNLERWGDELRDLPTRPFIAPEFWDAEDRSLPGLSSGNEPS